MGTRLRAGPDQCVENFQKPRKGIKGLQLALYNAIQIWRRNAIVCGMMFIEAVQKRSDHCLSSSDSDML